jgi:hypothetical protein
MAHVYCPACELVGKVVARDAAERLAVVHDDMHHRGDRTATVRRAGFIRRCLRWGARRRGYEKVQGRVTGVG